jgi:hypothetical protein
MLLLLVGDHFDMDLEWYFGRHAPRGRVADHHSSSNNRDGQYGQFADDNAIVDWVKVDMHVALLDDGDGSIMWNLIGAACTIWMESDSQH